MQSGCGMAIAKLQRVASKSAVLSLSSSSLVISENSTESIAVTLSERREVNTDVQVEILVFDSLMLSRFENLLSVVTIPAGQLSATLPISIKDDLIYQGRQVAEVVITPSEQSVPTGITSLTLIVDDDEVPPVLSIASRSVSEVASNVAVTVHLSHAHKDVITVNWVTGNGTAASGADFVADAGALTFAPGELSKNIVITLLPDAIMEGDETFTVTLSNANIVNIATAVATVTINDEDTGPTAILAGAPTGTNSDTVLNVAVSGADVVAYRYKVGLNEDCSDPLGYTSDVDVSDPIVDSIAGLADGQVILCVIGKDSSANYQLLTTATSANWLKDTSP